MVSITGLVCMVEVVSVTKKGQATIPKRLRKKYGIRDKVLVEECEGGILLRPLPSPNEDFGSLKTVFKGKTSRQLLEESRREEFKEEKERVERAGKTDV